MISRARRTLKTLSRRMWIRATMFSLLGLLAAILGLLLAPLIPDDFSTSIGADAADNILSIVASSMLAVTTFSLSTVVSAFSAATGNVTPRATKLMIEDRTAQNTLAVFVGTFLYSLATLILLSTNSYGEKGRVVLFGVTILVIILMVGTLLRWIDYLLRFGRVGETTHLVEQAADTALKERKDAPFLGGQRRMTRTLQSGMTPILAQAIGYVQHVDTEALQSLAETEAAEIHVLVLPGDFVHSRRPLAGWEGKDPSVAREAILKAFTIEPERSFDQDPRFGMIVLGEIASRALSPGINDQGTAIDVLGRAVRLLAIWSDLEPTEVKFPRVHVPSILIGELLDDVFSPIARDAVAVVEVQVRLQKSLQYLHDMGGYEMKAATRRQSASALQRVVEAKIFADDLDKIRGSAAWAAE